MLSKEQVESIEIDSVPQWWFLPDGKPPRLTGELLKETVLELYERLEQAEAELEDIRDAHTRVMSEQCPADEVHCACVPILRRELAELWEKVAWYFECIGVGSYVCRTTKAVFELANNTKHAEKELRDG